MKYINLFINEITKTEKKVEYTLLNSVVEKSNLFV